MRKMSRIVIVLVLLCFVSAFAVAEEAAMAATEEKAEKKGLDITPSVSFTQQLEAGSVNGMQEAGNVWWNSPVFSRTELKGAAKIKLNDMFAITPWFKDRLKFYVDPVAKLRFINYFYAGLTAALNLKPVSISIGVENRWGHDFKDFAANDVEYRLSPTLGFGLKLDVLKGLNISLTQMFEMYFRDGSTDLLDDFWLEGYYNVDLTLIDDPLKLGIFAYDVFIPILKPTDSTANTILNELWAGVKLGMGDVSLPIGFFSMLSVANDTDGTIEKTVDSTTGVKVGLNLKKGNASFNNWVVVGAMDNKTDGTSTLSDPKVEARFYTAVSFSF